MAAVGASIVVTHHCSLDCITSWGKTVEVKTRVRQKPTSRECLRSNNNLHTRTMAVQSVQDNGLCVTTSSRQCCWLLTCAGTSTRRGWRERKVWNRLYQPSRSSATMWRSNLYCLQLCDHVISCRFTTWIQPSVRWWRSFGGGWTCVVCILIMYCSNLTSTHSCTRYIHTHTHTHTYTLHMCTCTTQFTHTHMHTHTHTHMYTHTHTHTHTGMWWRCYWNRRGLRTGCRANLWPSSSFPYSVCWTSQMKLEGVLMQAILIHAIGVH